MSSVEDMLAAFDALLLRAKGESPAVLTEFRARLDAVIQAGTSAPEGEVEEGWHGLIGECSVMLELRRLIEQLQHTWPKLDADITSFQAWLRSIASESI